MGDDLEKPVNDFIKRISNKHKVLDIKMSASRYSETVMVIYEQLNWGK